MVKTVKYERLLIKGGRGQCLVVVRRYFLSEAWSNCGSSLSAYENECKMTMVI